MGTKQRGKKSRGAKQTGGGRGTHEEKQSTDKARQQDKRDRSRSRKRQRQKDSDWSRAAKEQIIQTQAKTTKRKRNDRVEGRARGSKGRNRTIK